MKVSTDEKVAKILGENSIMYRISNRYLSVYSVDIDLKN